MTPEEQLKVSLRQLTDRTADSYASIINLTLNNIKFAVEVQKWEAPQILGLIAEAQELIFVSINCIVMLMCKGDIQTIDTPAGKMPVVNLATQEAAALREYLNEYFKEQYEKLGMMAVMYHPSNDNETRH